MWQQLVQGLGKTRDRLMRIAGLVRGFQGPSEDFFVSLEETLLGADMGVSVTERLVSLARQLAEEQRITDGDSLLRALKGELVSVLGPAEPLKLEGPGPHVILVVGVNGSGKTTTVAKLAHYLKNSGYSVMLVASDTFRAAGIEQLEIWARRVGAEVVKHRQGADPSAVAFDGVTAARSRGRDVVVVDTAGRLQTKKNLMEELKKLRRVVEREEPGSVKEVLLTIDATVGQNGISQARAFAEAAGVTGIVLTKLDGTAKGGIVVAVKESLGIPVKFVGLGEGLDDLVPFEPVAFVEALFSGWSG
ncbi:MAG: signal recognition particle-docking protein FtsY [Clostridia bacterium]|nr:signal recognition particle-docking protein FtsY [Clostridia bacterium]